MELYLNDTSIKNNKYFKTHEELLALSNKELQEIKAYKKTEEINFLGRLKNNLMDTPEELDSYEEDIINRIKERLK